MESKKGKLKGVFWLLSALLMAVGFSLGFSFFVQQIPWSVERKLVLVYDGSYGKKCEANNLSSQVALDKLVKRIYPLKSDDHKFSLQVYVLREKSVNAFATLGGNVFINEALLLAASTPEELAGILAHEIEHVRLRHILQGVLVRLATAQGLKFVLFGDPASLSADTTATFLNMSFTKNEEAQADSEGLKRLQMADVSVKGIYNFFKRMESSSDLTALLSDHPSDSSRLLKLKPYLDKPSKEVLSEVEWISLKEICNH
jgi:predicted Zn-dependent protease